MDSDNGSRPWQFSLRSFLFAVLVVGLTSGVVGPIVLESITEWKPPPHPLPTRRRALPDNRLIEPDIYYESAETPLD